jgi:hypothetical protein
LAITTEYWELRANEMHHQRLVESETLLEHQARRLLTRGSDRLVTRAAQAVLERDVTPAEALLGTIYDLADERRMRNLKLHVR